MAFHFDKVLPAGKYWLEIWVEGYIFPSDRKTKIKIVKASKVRESTAKSLPSVRDLAGNLVTRVVIYDTINIYRDYPREGAVVVNPNNTIESIEYQNFRVTKTELSDSDLILITATNNPFGDKVDALVFEVGGQTYSLEVDVIHEASPSTPILESTDITLNRKNQFSATIPIKGLNKDSEEDILAAYWKEGEQSISLNLTTSDEGDVISFKIWSVDTSRESTLTLQLYHGPYVDEIPINVKIEV